MIYQARWFVPSIPKFLLRPLEARIAMYQGCVSYSLYMVHAPVLMIAAKVFPITSAPRLVLVWAIAAVSASVIYHTIEEPMRKRLSAMDIDAMLAQRKFRKERRSALTPLRRLQ